MSNKEAIAKAPSGRVRRTPVGVRNILTVKGQDPNYHYRIVNDTGDRIQNFIEAGYEIVKADEVTVGDKRVNKATAAGSNAEVSVGGGEKGFVMRIKKEWYEEDHKAKQAEVDATESSIRQKALDGTYGELKISRD